MKLVLEGGGARAAYSAGLVHALAQAGVRPKVVIGCSSGSINAAFLARAEEVIERVFAGEPLGTVFLAREGLSSRRRWIAFATTVEAAIVVNDGARRALIGGKASLLAAGVTSVRGEFARGDVVGVIDERGTEFARGLVNYSSAEARAVLGKPSSTLDQLVAERNYDALVTRDNLALLEGDAVD